MLFIKFYSKNQMNLSHQEDQKKQSKKTLVVASLNYSGVLTSPYEYFDSEDLHQIKMSQAFAEIVNKQYPTFLQGKGQKFTWDMGSIDTKWKNRFCPVNIVEVGTRNGYLLNEEQFSQQWEKVYKETIDSITELYFKKKYKGDELEKRIKIQVDGCRKFDLFCYRTLLKIYYNIDDLKNLPKTSAQIYLTKKKQQFKKPFLDELLKLENTVSCINITNHDIVFFQQANQILINGLKKDTSEKYHFIEKSQSDSIILVNKSLCGETLNYEQNNKQFLKKYSEELMKKNQNVTPQQLENILNFNKDSVFVTFGNYFILNVHLSSQKQKNPPQMKEVDAQLRRMVETMKGYHIIFGGDFNAQLNLPIIQDKNFHLSVYPNKKGQVTVMKKRTFMQPQRNKANKLDESAKDYMISTLKLESEGVILINGSNANGSLLPNSHHPYDHYMIKSVFYLPQKIRAELK